MVNNNESPSMEDILKKIKTVISKKKDNKNNNEVENNDNSVLELENEITEQDVVDNTLQNEEDLIAKVDVDEKPSNRNNVDELLSDIGSSGSEGSDISTTESVLSENEEEDDLLSDQTTKQSSEVIQGLVDELQNHPEVKDKIYLEDFIMQALKPILKEWLNDNLPDIIEKLVKAEIKKLFPSS